MRLRFAAVALVCLTCKSPGKTVNRFHGKGFAEDVMGKPSAFARRPSEDVAEQAARRKLEDLSISAAFQPSESFKFDKKSGLVFYEDGKGNGQVRRGLEIIRGGKIIDRGKESITLLTEKGYETMFDKSGIEGPTMSPEEIKDLERPRSR